MGIAQKLIDKMYETMLKKDVQRITLEVRKSNTPAISLYEKNGFSPIAVRKNYYTSPLEDGIVMEKHI
jgi:ribosomal-protein-alanine N-acetyltransferase